MAESQSAATTVAALINKGKLDEAYAVTMNHNLGKVTYGDANYWFMAALAARLLGRNETVAARWDTARMCTNYAPQMEGDFHRDAAIARIRDGEFDEAVRELRLAQTVHAGDLNREAAIDMVQGRLEFARENFVHAMFFHNRADNSWTSLQSDGKPFDAQWLLNNRYHRLRAAVSLLPGTARVARSDYRYVMTHSDDRRQRMGARMARFAGAEGVRSFDMLAARFSR